MGPQSCTRELGSQTNGVLLNSFVVREELAGARLKRCFEPERS